MSCIVTYATGRQRSSGTISFVIIVVLMVATSGQETAAAATVPEDGQHVELREEAGREPCRRGRAASKIERSSSSKMDRGFQWVCMVLSSNVDNAVANHVALGM